ncbi:MAG TPA: glutamyl-tRNA reductase [Rhabdochlamydiaceae bacterium]|nr:glutamyl-tRNA reductase [Rhabdochlamydiaceae bacterium]
MRIGVLGINHKSSELCLREIVAKVAEQCFGKKSLWGCWLKGVLLSTCNRTEIYFCGDKLPELHSQILSVLRGAILEPFEHGLYSYFGEDCFSHLAQVTSGLDSAVTFETEIQRQVKVAYENACQDHSLASELHFLFQKCLKMGKTVRTLFPSSRSSIGLEQTIFQVAQTFFRNLDDIAILFVGNSEINRKILSYFNRKSKPKIILGTRHVKHAEKCEENISICDLDQLKSCLDYELVICGSYFHDYFIRREELQKKSSFRLKLILDLAVPRNVDPHIKYDPHVQLLNIDDLSKFLDQKRACYEQEIQSCLKKIREDAEKQIMLFEQKTLQPVAQ